MPVETCVETGIGARASTQMMVQASPTWVTISARLIRFLANDHVEHTNGRKQIQLHAAAVRAKDVVERTESGDENVGDRRRKKIL